MRSSKILIALAGVAAMAWTPAHAYEAGAAGWAQKPGQVATSGCFAAHPDVAARTAGTNASGNHVTPSEGAASMRRGM
jgi:hypothetical protein